MTPEIPKIPYSIPSSVYYTRPENVIGHGVLQQQLHWCSIATCRPVNHQHICVSCTELAILVQWLWISSSNPLSHCSCTILYTIFMSKNVQNHIRRNVSNVHWQYFYVFINKIFKKINIYKRKSQLRAPPRSTRLHCLSKCFHACSEKCKLKT